MTLTRKTLYILVAVAMVCTLTLTAAAPVSAQQGPEISVTDLQPRADQPDVAVDSNGNVHIAYSAGTGAHYQAFGTTPNMYTVIQWNTSHHSGYGPGEFQAILYENGNIDANIADSSGASGSITGVNQGDGTHGVDVGGTPASSTSHHFTWNAGTSDYDYSAISYNWVDASGGNSVGVWEDDSSGSVPVGFDFTFYGTSYDTVYVSSNGYMSFNITDPTQWQNPASFPSSSGDTADVIAPLWDDWDAGLREIWYAMLDNNGNTLIDNTRITEADGVDSTRPAIVVDSDDKVHIVWRDERWDDGASKELTYQKLDPYLDDMDGDAGSEAAITLVADARLTDIGSWYLLNFRMSIDSNDDIHIVWEDDDDYEIYYMKIDDSGNELVAETAVRYAMYIGRASPDVAVDSNDNPHIAWNDWEDTDSPETYYMMLNGSDGSTLIDATLISDDDHAYSKGQSIVVDFEDKVHIFWKDQRGDGQAVYYTKLDPSLDDQDTDEADESTITLIDDTAVSTDSSVYWVKRVASAIACGRYIHISWWEDYDDNDHGYLYYMVLDTYGNTEVTERTLTTGETVTTSTSWTVPYLDVDSNGKAHITWCDDRDGDFYEVYYTSYQGPPCLSEEPIMTIDKDVVGDPPVMVVPGGTVQYTINVTNTGTADALDVSIWDTLPAWFTYASTDSIVDTCTTRWSTVNPTPGNTTPLWGYWDIPSGYSVVITFTADVDLNIPAGTYQNNALANGDNFEQIDDIGSQQQDSDTPQGQDPAVDEDVFVQSQPPLPSAVPTLSQWGMMAMGMLLAAALVWSVRRRWVISADKS